MKDQENTVSQSQPVLASNGHTKAQPSAATEIRHGKWLIYPTDPVPPIPTWAQFAWSYTHDDYDGPEDNRHGCAPSIEACIAEIDEREADAAPPEGWRKAQGARCGCGGSDDLCACQCEYTPAKYGLMETEACGECGLLASSLTHRLCTRPDCPIPAHLAASEASPLGAEPGSNPNDRRRDEQEPLPLPTREAEPSGGCRRCAECEGQEHHWMYVGDEDARGDPVMSCKHCEVTRPLEDDDE